MVQEAKKVGSRSDSYADYDIYRIPFEGNKREGETLQSFKNAIIDAILKNALLVFHDKLIHITMKPVKISSLIMIMTADIYGDEMVSTNRI